MLEDGTEKMRCALRQDRMRFQSHEPNELRPDEAHMHVDEAPHELLEEPPAQNWDSHTR